MSNFNCVYLFLLPTEHTDYSSYFFVCEILTSRLVGSSLPDLRSDIRVTVLPCSISLLRKKEALFTGCGASPSTAAGCIVISSESSLVVASSIRNNYLWSTYGACIFDELRIISNHDPML